MHSSKFDGNEIMERRQSRRRIPGLAATLAFSLGLTTALTGAAIAAEAGSDGVADYVSTSSTSSISGTVTVPEGLSLVNGDVKVAAVYADATPAVLDVADGDVVTVGSATAQTATLSGLVERDSEAAIGLEPYLVPDAVPVVGKTEVLADGTFEVTDLEVGAYKLVFVSDTVEGAPIWYKDATNFFEAETITLDGTVPVDDIDVALVPADDAYLAGDALAGGSESDGLAEAKEGDSGLDQVSPQPTEQPRDDLTVLPMPDGQMPAGVGTIGTGPSVEAPGSESLEQSADKPFTRPDAKESKEGESNLFARKDLSFTERVGRVLSPGAGVASISGRVTFPTGLVVPEEIMVIVEDEDRADIWFDVPAADGTYEVAGLPAGNYYVSFVPSHGINLVRQWWNDADNEGEATLVTLSDGEAKTHINAAMVQGGTITGKVTVPAGAGSITGVEVLVFRTDVYSYSYAYVEEDGTYEVAGLAAGSYKVQFSGQGTNVIQQWWNGTAAGAFDDFGATVIEVSAGAVQPNINAQMQKGASISGKVTVPAGLGSPSDTVVWVYDEFYQYFETARPEEDGTYEIQGLPARTYRVEFSSYLINVVPQWWNGATDIESATKITLGAGESRTNINATLVKGATISGKITVASGGAEPGSVFVEVYTVEGDYARGAYADDDGNYEVEGLYPGTYKVKFSPEGGSTISQWWTGTDGGSPTQNGAATITLPAQGTRAGIDAWLVAGGRITGKVTVPSGIGSPTDVNVWAYDSSYDIAEWAPVEADGTYVLDGLQTGIYWVHFDAPDINVEEQWWKDAANESDATSIPIEPGVQVSDVNATMRKGATISGKVTIPPTFGSLDLVWVSAYNADGERVTDVGVDANGNYKIIGLSSGEYRILVYTWDFDVAWHWWDGTLAGALSMSSATPIPLASGGSRTGINVTMTLGSSIKGTVHLPDGDAEVGQAMVAVYDPSGGLVRVVWPEHDGRYEIGNLPPATYNVLFAPKFDFGGVLANVLEQWWTGSPGGASTQAGAGPVVTHAGQSTDNIDATLVRGAQIRVELLRGEGVSVDSMLELKLFDSSGTLVWERYGAWWAGSQSHALIGGLTPGTYKLSVIGHGGSAASQWWDNNPTMESADPIVVTGTETKDIQVLVRKTPPGTPSLVAPTNVKILGTATVGQTLSVSGGAKTDFVPAADSVSYQWLANGSAIAGATAATYTLVAGDAGKKVSVRVTGVKAGYDSASATSAEVTVAAKPTLLNIRRLAGTDRYRTNVAVNNVLGGVGKPVFVATGGTFADALSIGPAVALTGGTLFLTATSGLSSESLQAIKAKNPSHVYVVGGTGAVSQNVVGQLTKATGKSVRRISGSSRYETSANIFTTFFADQPVKYAFVATGRAYPDALSAAAAGGALKAPVLLVDGVVDTNVSKQMMNLLATKAPETIYVAGGRGAVNATIESNLSRLTPVKRLSGSSRYETNAAVNAEVNLKAAAEGVSPEQVWIATGGNFPDALSAAVPSGNLNQRLVLSTGACIPKPVVSSWIKGPGSKVSTVSLVGGTGALSPAVEQLKECG